MKPREYIDFLNRIEKLKCNTRHSWTSDGRHESVAEHCWRLGVMAMLCADEYPDVDIDKVIKMCLIHDLGESITGDIPAFNKNADDRIAEKKAVELLVSLLPETLQNEFSVLFSEMYEMNTAEAKLYKSLDNLEALISHNEADLATWLPNEYHDNLVYGQENCEWSDWTKALKEEIRIDSVRKIESS